MAFKRVDLDGYYTTKGKDKTKASVEPEVRLC